MNEHQPLNCTFWSPSQWITIQIVFFPLLHKCEKTIRRYVKLPDECFIHDTSVIVRRENVLFSFTTQNRVIMWLNLRVITSCKKIPSVSSRPLVLCRRNREPTDFSFYVKIKKYFDTDVKSISNYDLIFKIKDFSQKWKNIIFPIKEGKQITRCVEINEITKCCFQLCVLFVFWFFYFDLCFDSCSSF